MSEKAPRTLDERTIAGYEDIQAIVEEDIEEQRKAKLLAHYNGDDKEVRNARDRANRRVKKLGEMDALQSHLEDLETKTIDELDFKTSLQENYDELSLSELSLGLEAAEAAQYDFEKQALEAAIAEKIAKLSLNELTESAREAYESGDDYMQGLLEDRITEKLAAYAEKYGWDDAAQSQHLEHVIEQVYSKSEQDPEPLFKEGDAINWNGKAYTVKAVAAKADDGTRSVVLSPVDGSEDVITTDRTLSEAAESEDTAKLENMEGFKQDIMNLVFASDTMTDDEIRARVDEILAQNNISAGYSSDLFLEELPMLRERLIGNTGDTPRVADEPLPADIPRVAPQTLGERLRDAANTAVTAPVVWAQVRANDAVARRNEAGQDGNKLSRRRRIGLAIAGVAFLAVGVGVAVAAMRNGMSAPKPGGLKDGLDTFLDPSTAPKPSASAADTVGSTFSVEARHISKGEGWYQTFKELGVKSKDRATLLAKVGPKLQQMGIAYKDPSIGGYGISHSGTMPKKALVYINSVARELGMVK